nr:unnamed protein product [Callosobruchus analis]
MLDEAVLILSILLAVESAPKMIQDNTKVCYLVVAWAAVVDGEVVALPLGVAVGVASVVGVVEDPYVVAAEVVVDSHEELVDMPPPSKAAPPSRAVWAVTSVPAVAVNWSGDSPPDEPVAAAEVVEPVSRKSHPDPAKTSVSQLVLRASVATPESESGSTTDVKSLD